MGNNGDRPHENRREPGNELLPRKIRRGRNRAHRELEYALCETAGDYPIMPLGGEYEPGRYPENELGL